MYTITFRTELGGAVTAPARLGESILSVAQTAGIAIDAPCGGNGTCGKCKLRDESGDWLLACQTEVTADAELFVPASASAFKTGIMTAGLMSEGELARYEKSISGIFASGLERGVPEQGTGLAVDIGTTTVSAALLDLESGKIVARANAGNAQIRYGADVINRIIQSSRPGGRELLQRAILEETLLPLISELRARSGVGEISRAVIAGNTTMEHLLVAADAESIRLEPYVPEFLELPGQTGATMGIPVNADAPVILAPNVGSYVGGDITAGVLATPLWSGDELCLFIDLGTNGELVLGSSEFMLCCACSAGPAFEGGDISCGMRAMSGAIEAVTIDAETMEPRLEVIGGGEPQGICGSGIIDAISELYRCGIIDARGRFLREGERVRRGEYECSYVLYSSGETSIELTEVDIDSFIRAKGAIYSAIKSMLLSLDMEASALDRVLIAGGIGSGINIENAIAIGMLPRLPLDKYEYIGNSSLTGACAMLLSTQAEEKVFELGRSMTYLELSSHPGYMDEFVAACFLATED